MEIKRFKINEGFEMYADDAAYIIMQFDKNGDIEEMPIVGDDWNYNCYNLDDMVECYLKHDGVKTRKWIIKRTEEIADLSSYPEVESQKYNL